MAPKIEVAALGEGKFQVRVAEGSSQSTHQVTISGEYYRQLTSGQYSEETLLERPSSPCSSANRRNRSCRDSI